MYASLGKSYLVLVRAVPNYFKFFLRVFQFQPGISAQLQIKIRLH